jgi:hypothetical protein
MMSFQSLLCSLVISSDTGMKNTAHLLEIYTRNESARTREVHTEKKAAMRIEMTGSSDAG